MKTEFDLVYDILKKHGFTKGVWSDKVDERLYFDLYEHFLNSGRMPYDIAKARSGDPFEWVLNELDNMGLIRD